MVVSSLLTRPATAQTPVETLKYKNPKYGKYQCPKRDAGNGDQGQAFPAGPLLDARQHFRLEQVLDPVVKDRCLIGNDIANRHNARALG